jgi:hypothetical protein
MTHQPHTAFFTARRLGLLGAAGLLGFLAAPLETMAAPWDGAPPPARAPYTRVSYPVVQGQSAYATTPVLSEAQIAQRCNIGRLMGGIVGGGVGYVASRQDGRSWAVPLGALLGTQMGCNLGRGNAPLPW